MAVAAPEREGVAVRHRMGGNHHGVLAVRTNRRACHRKEVVYELKTDRSIRPVGFPFSQFLRIHAAGMDQRLARVGAPLLDGSSFLRQFVADHSATGPQEFALVALDLGMPGAAGIVALEGMAAVQCDDAAEVAPGLPRATGAVLDGDAEDASKDGFHGVAATQFVFRWMA